MNIDAKALRALLANATPRPWLYDGDYNEIRGSWANRPGNIVVAKPECPAAMPGGMMAANGELLVALVNNADALLAMAGERDAAVRERDTASQVAVASLTVNNKRIAALEATLREVDLKLTALERLKAELDEAKRVLGSLRGDVKWALDHCEQGVLPVAGVMALRRAFDTALAARGDERGSK